jgi:hypothetical protein
MPNTRRSSFQEEGSVNNPDVSVRHPQDLGVAWSRLPTGFRNVIYDSL